MSEWHPWVAALAEFVGSRELPLWLTCERLLEYWDSPRKPRRPCAWPEWEGHPGYW